MTLLPQTVFIRFHDESIKHIFVGNYSLSIAPEDGALLLVCIELRVRKRARVCSVCTFLLLLK